MKTHALRMLLVTAGVSSLMVSVARADVQERLFKEYNGWREQCQNYQDPPNGQTTEGCHTAAPAPEPPPAPVAEAAPPPPPPAPVAESKSYIIYFDVGKSTLSPEAQNVIAQAAAEAAALGELKVKVSGYTSTSSSEGFNQKLSQNRAAAVAKALGTAGVGSDKIVAEAHGENSLAVPTPDKTEMPGNRRVVIDVSGVRTPAQ